MSESDWKKELAILEKRGVVLAPPMTSDEFGRAEDRLGARFPADLHSLLSTALPVSPGFPNWRLPAHTDVADHLAWPFDGIAFDIEHNSFWWPEWGPRPPDLADAIRVAEAQVAHAPRLIPIYNHRFLPAEPGSAGNPVFSVYQTDIVYYGANLRSYIACEFGGLPYAEAVSGVVRHIRFWSDLVS